MPAAFWLALSAVFIALVPVLVRSTRADSGKKRDGGGDGSGSWFGDGWGGDSDGGGD